MRVIAIGFLDYVSASLREALTAQTTGFGNDFENIITRLDNDSGSPSELPPYSGRPPETPAYSKPLHWLGIFPVSEDRPLHAIFSSHRAYCHTSSAHRRRRNAAPV